MSFLSTSGHFRSLSAWFGQNKSIHSKPIADAYKLYAHFLIVENSGLVGIPITIFVYLVEIILASSIFYVYFLKIHNNGRLLDTYHRLHGAEEDFLVPYDQEISAKVYFSCFVVCKINGPGAVNWTAMNVMEITVQLSSRPFTFERTTHFQELPLILTIHSYKEFISKTVFEIYFRNWLIFVEKLKPGEVLKVKEEKQS